MASSRRIIFLLIALSCSLCTVESFTCEEEGLFGITERIQCPRPGEPDTYTSCCGTKRNRYCCDRFFSGQDFDDLFDDEDFDDFIDNIPTIIGTVVGVTLGMIVLCVVCCCCCPFCLMYKKRNRGTVHQPTTDAAMQPLQQQQGYPAQPGGYPGQQPAPYATQAPYPAQAQPYPQHQSYPAQPYPQQQPYPGQYAPPPHMGGDQPPPYTEKQPGYNPGYGH